MKKIKIGNGFIGEGEPTFIVAEISCNHLQKKEYALKLIEEAKNAGADAVKFQTYTPDTITLDIDNKYFRIQGTLWDGKTLYELYKEAYTPWEWFSELKDKAADEGILFFSTPFDESSVDFLEELEVPVYKVASFEINHIPMIKKIAALKKPIILSTGIATIADIELALQTIRSEGNEKIALLKCTSAYPAPLNEMNLATISDMEKRFNCVVGLSDHSVNSSVPIAAVALGAKLIEKHLMFKRGQGSLDDAFSLEPKEFRAMVDAVRDAEQSIGKITYDLGKKVLEHKFSMRSVFVTKDIKKGEVFTRENIRIIRPGHGLHPKYYETIIGKIANKDIKKGTPLEFSLVEMVD